MKKLKCRRILYLLILGVLMMSFLQEDGSIRNLQKIITSLNNYTASRTDQKIHLHLDKYQYFAGETIWIKAYLVDAANHILAGQKDPMYIELINPFQKKVQAIRLRMFDGEGTGSFSLKDTVPAGIYTILAYTNWMRNSDSRFFFQRHLEIQNVKNEYQLTSKEANKNKDRVRKIHRQNEEYQIGLFPEGGQLLEGVNTKIAFKITDGFGNGIDVSGEIVDDKKNVITKFNTIHSGMGSFNLKPAKDLKYNAIFLLPDGSTRKVSIPEAQQNNVALSVYNDLREQKITITIKTNRQHSSDVPANSYILLGQVRGKPYYATTLNLLKRDTSIIIDHSHFPSGIVQLTLFNHRLLPVSERLVFVNHDDFTYFNITGRKSSDSVYITISPVNQFTGKYLAGSISVNLLPAEENISEQGNIVSQLLLSSDLPGYINDPAYYLDKSNVNAYEHADLLMLTHGWKRFEWKEVLDDQPQIVNFEHEKSISINGKITREIIEIPVENAKVTLRILSSFNDEYETTTDEKGNFSFVGLDYTDTIDAKIIARKPAGGKNVLIKLNEEGVSMPTFISKEYFLTTNSKMDLKKYRIEQARITREKIKEREKELDSIYSGSIYGAPDDVIWGHEIPNGTRNVMEVIEGRIPGVNVTGDDIIIRGPNTILGSSEPLALIDGSPVSFDALQNIPIEDIERIEILKGPSTAIFGSRGANGVIAVYTKHGSFMKHGEITFSMLGYHVIEKFQAPGNKHISNRINQQQLPITVFWKPDIKINNDEEIVVKIALPTLAGKNLQVLFEGISDSGNIGYGQVILSNK